MLTLPLILGFRYRSSFKKRFERKEDFRTKYILQIKYDIFSNINILHKIIINLIFQWKKKFVYLDQIISITMIFQFFVSGPCAVLMISLANNKIFKIFQLWRLNWILTSPSSPLTGEEKGVWCLDVFNQDLGVMIADLYCHPALSDY